MMILPCDTKEGSFLPTEAKHSKKNSEYRNLMSESDWNVKLKFTTLFLLKISKINVDKVCFFKRCIKF